MKPKANKPAPPAPPAPRWHVSPLKWPEFQRHEKRRRRVKVALLCDGVVAHEGHGRVFWRNCQELAERYNRAAMILRPAPPQGPGRLSNPGSTRARRAPRRPQSLAPMKKITVYAKPALHARLVLRARRNGRSLAAQCLMDIQNQIGFEDHQASTANFPISQAGAREPVVQR